MHAANNFINLPWLFRRCGLEKVNMLGYRQCSLRWPMVITLLLIHVLSGYCVSSLTSEVITASDSNPLAVDAVQDLLIVATLDGHLHGVNKHSGEISWTVRDTQGKVSVLPRPKATDKKLFLPDPRDGSLYFFDIDTGIRKLPMSIPELVRAAPSRSADGLFYTGRKHASWIAINPITGIKWELQGEGADEASCPLTDRTSILIPKIEYVLSLFDTNSKINWNATYRHYGESSRSQPELDPFDTPDEDGSFLLSSTNSGHLAKLNAVEKKLKWCGKFESPVVSIFSPSTSTGNLRSYSFYAMPDDAMKSVLNKDFRRLNKILALPSLTAPLSNKKTEAPDPAGSKRSTRRTRNSLKNYLRGESFTREASSAKIRERFSNNMALYIGHFNNEMYAMPSVGDNVVVVGDPERDGSAGASTKIPADGLSLTISSDYDEVLAEGQETGLVKITEAEAASCYIPAVHVHAADKKRSQTALLAGPAVQSASDKNDNVNAVFSADDADLKRSENSPHDLSGKPLSTESVSDSHAPQMTKNVAAKETKNIITQQHRFVDQIPDRPGTSDNSCIADGPLADVLGLHLLPREDPHQLVESDFAHFDAKKKIDWYGIGSHRTPAALRGDVAGQFVPTSMRYWNSTSMFGAVMLGLLIGAFGVFVTVYFDLFKLFAGEARSIRGRTSRLGNSRDHNNNNSGEGGHSVEKIVVGNKMEYYPNKLLGRGCDGTCVFKGRFDNRDVAVKRLLPDCFRLADREVAIMKHADTHPNVIRYYCTEADSQFRYIALELCNATLADYVEGKTDFELDMKFVLLQAVNGLKHLHSLNIVHRDVKPRNVLLAYNADAANVVGLGVSHAGMHNVGDDAQRAALLSAPSTTTVTPTTTRVRVLISDFGLCKQVAPGRVSLTKHTGLIGTEGWIAPELVLAQRAGQTANVNYRSDIFSMGCLFYYCLTNGEHPHGEEFSRQVNIVQGSYALKALDARSTTDQESFLVVHLVEQMIQYDPSARPTAACVMSHPYFWTKARRLAFLQDVSDRIEKADARSAVIRALENNHRLVVERDWIRLIGTELQRDLQSHRTYNRASVRDLLRAIRNKKHHYSELSEAVRHELGELTDAFLDYFTGRFPRLFMHVYLAMQMQVRGAQDIGAYYSPECKWMPLRVPPENWRHDEDDDDATPGVENNIKMLSSSPLGGSSPMKSYNMRRPPFAVNGFGLPPWHHQNNILNAVSSTLAANNNVTANNNFIVQEKNNVNGMQPVETSAEYIDEYFPNGPPNTDSAVPDMGPKKLPSVLEKIMQRHRPKAKASLQPQSFQPIVANNNSDPQLSAPVSPAVLHASPTARDNNDVPVIVGGDETGSPAKVHD